jgi:hypothetical protein
MPDWVYWLLHKSRDCATEEQLDHESAGRKLGQTKSKFCELTLQPRGEWLGLWWISLVEFIPPVRLARQWTYLNTDILRRKLDIL